MYGHRVETMWSAYVALGTLAAVIGGCAAGGAYRGGYVSTPVGRLYFEERGSGPAVVLIHGGQMDRRMWDDQFARPFPGGHRLIRYDIRGYGRSPAASKPYANHADLLAVLDHLRVDRATLIGLSYGGQIAVDFALAHPERVDKLVPVAAGLSGYTWGADAQLSWVRLMETAQTGDGAAIAEAWLADPMMAGVAERPDLRKRVQRLIHDNAACWLNNPLLIRDLRPPAAARLGEVRAPTLVIVGERDVADIRAIADLLAAQIPGARRVVIPGASHMVNLEAPEAFESAVRAFLESGAPR